MKLKLFFPLILLLSGTKGFAHGLPGGSGSEPKFIRQQVKVTEFTKKFKLSCGTFDIRAYQNLGNENFPLLVSFTSSGNQQSKIYHSPPFNIAELRMSRSQPPVGVEIRFAELKREVEVQMIYTKKTATVWINQMIEDKSKGPNYYKWTENLYECEASHN